MRDTIEVLTIIKTLRNPRSALAGGSDADSPRSFKFPESGTTLANVLQLFKVRIDPNIKKQVVVG